MSTHLDVTTVYDSLLEWLHIRAFGSDSPEVLLDDFAQKLSESGVQLMRMHISLRRNHPLYAIGAYTWRRGQGVEVDNYARGITKEGSALLEQWRASPMRVLYERGGDEWMIPLIEEGEGDQFPMLVAAREQGGTGYLVQFTGLGDRGLAAEDQDGVILTYTTDAADGFSDNVFSLLRKLRLPLSAYLKGLSQRRLVDDILDAYLGKLSGARVLDGQIQRGDGDLIEAVIVFSDLRGSSSLAEHYGLETFLDILNLYFEVTAGAVMDHDGEVLRFIGDASLAIFPFEKFGSAEVACATALAAAKDAVERGKRMNAAREEAGDLPIGFGIGLHVGAVMYGNIGTPDRIEFSVIGRAANEAARIESKCKDLDRQILASDAFAKLADADWETHGSFELRNIGEAMEILSLK